ncbi:bifunctional DNA-formamidopyrimidine glycosylase/DNA-(apurinic or apyrimidinic site) lyase [Methylomarinum vadi]|uniref:bifunctional DNA-formamidopyrimidine glycosylase/DNA-(apurinic or apyrimidinic site) lyase n=1 Tax=Methylomarinum vadi TaxID=438855 RepID=UPI0004DF705A|nr:bifunctional DNA-formamidopyrimidine glycosylase/DNA-(apurinic or apyrimidinic site) lyase [Methylomarinum vadi]
MPELPEVETTRRGIAPHIENKPIIDVIVRQPRLRWPVPSELPILLRGLRFHHIGRRAKYLLLECTTGTLIIHLGMSGSLRIVAPTQSPAKHDHIDWVFADDTVLRFNDPRKFGAVLWSEKPPASHPLLARLGPEPLSAEFDGEYLYRLSRGRKTAVKSFIMDGHIVVGVGNIYANESLFLAGILPSRQAGRISLLRYQALADAIKCVLQSAIEQGGTTLRDFVNESGKPGYFQQSLFVYGRAGQPCKRCSMPIKQIKIGQRASYFCYACQS